MSFHTGTNILLSVMAVVLTLAGAYFAWVQIRRYYYAKVMLDEEILLGVVSQPFSNEYSMSLMESTDKNGRLISDPVGNELRDEEPKFIGSNLYKTLLNSPFTLFMWVRVARNRLLRLTPFYQNTAQGGVLELRENSTELIYFVIYYDGKIVFRPFRWWFKFETADGIESERQYKIYPPKEDDVNYEQPIIHQGEEIRESFLIANGDPDDPTYDTIAHRPATDKQVIVLQEDFIRCELDYYTSGHKILIPLFVNTPCASSDYDIIKAEVDPPYLPIKVEKSIKVNITRSLPRSPYWGARVR